MLLAHARTDDWDGARAIAAKAADPVTRAELFYALAGAQADAGKTEAARESLRSVPVPLFRAFAAQSIAAKDASDGKLEEVKAWAAGLTTPQERAYACVGAARGVSPRPPTTGPAVNGLLDE